jgi:hypothetical protein
MKPTRQQAIRELLLKNAYGLTRQEISDTLGFHVSNITKAIKGMPDVFVDRWIMGQRGQYQKIFCIVFVPEDCPHPQDKIYRGGRGKPKTVWVNIQ